MYDKIISECSCESSEYRESVRLYICERFSIPDDPIEKDIYKLAIASIRKQFDGRVGNIEELLAGSDCHRTTLAVQKKILIIMEIEKLAGIRLDAETADSIKSTDDCADAVFDMRHRTR